MMSERQTEEKHVKHNSNKKERKALNFVTVQVLKSCARCAHVIKLPMQVAYSLVLIYEYQFQAIIVMAMYEIGPH